MMLKSWIAIALVMLVACSSGASSGGSKSTAECDALAKEIRDSAVKRGYDGDNNGVPDGLGVCNDPSPAIRKDFAAACDDLKANCP